MYHLDPRLREYAITERQRECLDALAEHGSHAKAADALGIHKSRITTVVAAVRKRAAAHGYAPDHDMHHPVPDGFRARGVSTLYDLQSGEARLQWVKSSADQERQEQMFREAIEAMTADLPRVKPIKAPAPGADELMVFIPVGDAHLGQFSWHEETGANYDIKIGERLLVGATDELLRSAPKANTCVIAFMGDFMDYDSWEAVTPTSKNLMDADGRFPMMVRAAIRCMRYMVEAAAKRFPTVHVKVEIGNHDLASSIFLMECLANIYEANDRITVDTSPRHFHFYEFGRVALGLHHGHGVKMADLPILMATDIPDVWGRTEHRYFWTGHIHHKSLVGAKDHSGCTVESLRVLPPRSAFADQKGYRAPRDMMAITYHREYGERSRYTVNPDMLEAA